MILLWGLPGDTPIARVEDALIRHGHPSFFVDEQAILETTVTLSAVDASEGSLRTDRAMVDLADITAVYQRPYGIDRVPALTGEPRARPLQRHHDPWAARRHRGPRAASHRSRGGSPCGRQDGTC